MHAYARIIVLIMHRIDLRSYVREGMNARIGRIYPNTSEMVGMGMIR